MTNTDITIEIDGNAPSPTHFFDLVDVPTSYSGQSGKLVSVKSTEDGLEFTTKDTEVGWGEIQGTLSDQTDLQSALDLKLNSSGYTDPTSHIATTSIHFTQGSISIPHTQINDWNTATTEFLTSYTETDPVFSNWENTTSYLVDGDNVSSLVNDVAYLTSESDPVFTAWDKSTGIIITESQISDLGSYYPTTNPSGFISSLTSFTSDDLTEGSTNKYDQTVSLTEGSNVTITGTYPNFTINAAGQEYTSSDFDLSSLGDVVTTTSKVTGSILSVNSDGNHTYIRRNAENGYLGLNEFGEAVGTLIPRTGSLSEIGDVVPNSGELVVVTDYTPHVVCLGDGTSNVSELVPLFLSDLTNTASIMVFPTGSATENATALKAAYASACALTPNGAALSTTNRASVMIFGGVYDFGAGDAGGGLLLDTSYVDIIGIGDVTLKGTLETKNTGILTQTADDIKIKNIKLYVTHYSTHTNYCYYFSGSFPNTTWEQLTFERENNIYAKLMPYPGTYSGTYIDCTALQGLAFGGSAGSVASGTFIRCKGGDNSFGVGPGSVASGYFEDCQLIGNNGFGYYAIGTPTTVSGTFIRCKVTGNGAFGGFVSTNNGYFKDCTAGQQAFMGDCSGTYIDCTATEYCFSPGATLSGKFYNCIGGTGCFGIEGTITSAVLVHCVGGAGSFGTKAPSAKAFFCVNGSAQYAYND